MPRTDGTTPPREYRTAKRLIMEAAAIEMEREELAARQRETLRRLSEVIYLRERRAERQRARSPHPGPDPASPQALAA